jgi:hypothetical protein
MRFGTNLGLLLQIGASLAVVHTGRLQDCRLLTGIRLDDSHGRTALSLCVWRWLCPSPAFQPLLHALKISFEDQLSSTRMTPAKIRKAVQDATEIFDACTKTGGSNDESRIKRACSVTHPVLSA